MIKTDGPLSSLKNVHTFIPPKIFCQSYWVPFGSLQKWFAWSSNHLFSLRISLYMKFCCSHLRCKRGSYPHDLWEETDASLVILHGIWEGKEGERFPVHLLAIWQLMWVTGLSHEPRSAIAVATTTIESQCVREHFCPWMYSPNQINFWRL